MVKFYLFFVNNIKNIETEYMYGTEEEVAQVENSLHSIYEELVYIGRDKEGSQFAIPSNVLLGSIIFLIREN